MIVNLEAAEILVYQFLYCNMMTGISSIYQSMLLVYISSNFLESFLYIRQSFTMHLVRLMTSWAVVCDVWYLEPQYLRPGETPIEFAER